jgi:hypothetical protein
MAGGGEGKGGGGQMPFVGLSEWGEGGCRPKAQNFN